MNDDSEKRLLSSILEGRDSLSPDVSDSILDEQADSLTDDEASRIDDGNELVGEIRAAVGAAAFAKEAALQQALEALAPASSTPVPDDTSTAEERLRIGERLGAYEIVELIGAGGMGTVYRARQTTLDRDVAIKLIHPSRFTDEKARRRFQREVEAMGALNHPNLVLALDAGDSQHGPFLAMEYVDGQSLAQLLRRNGPVPWKQACDWIRQATLGLQHAHAQTLVHRDIKPANLMLANDGTIRVLDLGLARLRSSDAATHTRTGAMMGTVDYMAPEQATDAARVDARADLYSLGCTLFELIAGRPPFASVDMPSQTQRILAHLRTPAPRLRSLVDNVPSELDELVARLLRKAPEERFASAGDVLHALDLLLQASDGPSEGRKSTPSSKSPVIKKRAAGTWRALFVGGALLVGAMVVVLASPFLRHEDEDSTTDTGASSPPSVNASPAPAPNARIEDVLPLDELAACAVRGDWTRVEDSLISSSSPTIAFLQVPYAPRGEYDVIAEVTPLDENAMIMVGMAAGEHPFHVLLAPKVTVLENVDGFDARGNRAARSALNHGMTLGSRSRVECRVRRDRIVVIVDGVELIDWRGDQSRLSRNPFYASLYGNALFLASQYRVRFHSLQVREWSEPGERLPPPLLRKAVDRRLALAELGESLDDVLEQLTAQNSTALLKLECDTGIAPGSPFLLRARFEKTPCDAATIGSLAKLDVPLAVDLLYCHEVSPELLHQILSAPRLVQLDLSETSGLTEDHLASSNSSPVLRFLGLGKAVASGMSPDAFRGFGSLRYVWAHQSSLPDATLAQLAKCKELEVLGLPPGTTDACFPSFAEHPTLRHLEVLGASDVTDASVPLFKSLPNLRYLKLDRTSISEKGRDELKQSPNRQVNYLPRIP